MCLHCLSTVSQLCVVYTGMRCSLELWLCIAAVELFAYRLVCLFVCLWFPIHTCCRAGAQHF